MKAAEDQQVSSTTQTRSNVSGYRGAPNSILLVEDNPVNQRVALLLLARLGHDADTAQHGQEALDRLEQGYYDLILMDLQMPVLDGLAATREIRSRTDRPQPKIIAVTAHTFEEDRQRCVEVGMDGFVPKPVTLSELDRSIRALFPEVPA